MDTASIKDEILKGKKEHHSLLTKISIRTMFLGQMKIVNKWDAINFLKNIL